MWLKDVTETTPSSTILGMAILSRHGYDAVAVRVVKRLLVPRFGIGLLDAVRPPSPATAERHR